MTTAEVASFLRSVSGGDTHSHARNGQWSTFWEEKEGDVTSSNRSDVISTHTLDNNEPTLTSSSSSSSPWSRREENRVDSRPLPQTHATLCLSLFSFSFPFFYICVRVCVCVLSPCSSSSLFFFSFLSFFLSLFCFFLLLSFFFHIKQRPSEGCTRSSSRIVAVVAAAMFDVEFSLSLLFSCLRWVGLVCTVNEPIEGGEGG